MRTTVGIAILGTVLLASCSQGQNISVPVPIQHQSQSVFGPSSAARPRTSTETLYGTTQAGGSSSCKKLNFSRVSGCGIVFSVTSSGSKSTLYIFQGGSDGKNPNGGLIEDSEGSLYGTTVVGGGSSSCPQGCGTVFKLTPMGSLYSERVLYAFQGGSDGVSPNAKLLADSQGALYGTTALGGASGCRCGTVFKLAPSGSSYMKIILYSFRGGSDGKFPWGKLIAEAGGVLYGTTSGGGARQCSGGCGTAFKLTPSGSSYSETVIYRFQGGPDGSLPNTVVADTKGVLYGTTRFGGISKCFVNGRIGQCGTIFKLTPSDSGYAHSVLYSFKGHNQGGVPVGSLLINASGTLFGTTPRNNAGACCEPLAFKLVHSGGGYQFRIIHVFNHTDDGQNLNGSLIASPAGTLYGTDLNGGNSFQCFWNRGGGCGFVFELKLSGSRYAEKVLYKFKQTQGDGDGPSGDLLLGD